VQEIGVEFTNVRGNLGPRGEKPANIDLKHDTVIVIGIDC